MGFLGIQLGWRCVDHRGNHHWRRARRDRQAVDKAAFIPMSRKELRACGWWYGVGITTAALGFGLTVFVSPTGPSSVQGTLLQIGSAVLMFIGFLLCAVGIQRIVIVRKIPGAAERALREALFRGVCGVCGYAICGLEPENDGCTVYPECGAAWRLETAP